MSKENEDVQKDQTSSDTGLPMEDQAVMDLLEDTGEESNDDSGEENKEDKENQDESEEDSEGSEEKKDDEESQSSEETDDDSKSDEDKEDKGKEGDSKEGTEGEENDDEEPFAKIGDQIFQTKEELITFTKSQQGFNRLVVGNIKKIHPDWFDEKGKLIPEKMKSSDKKDVKDAKDVIEKAEEQAGEGKEINFTEKDKEKLRKMGFVFKEDLDPIKESIEESEDKELEKWVGNHPGSESYSTDLAELTSDGKLTLDEAWDIVKKRNNIAEETPEEKDKTYKDGLKDGKKKKSLDNSSSSASGGKTGQAPEKSEGDIMDDIMNAGGL